MTCTVSFILNFTFPLSSSKIRLYFYLMLINNYIKTEDNTLIFPLFYTEDLSAVYKNLLL